MSNFFKNLGRILGGLLIALVLLVIIAGIMPVPLDEAVAPEDYGAGALSVIPSITGLQREFPPLNSSADNLSTNQKEELGRFLFFDPILSENNDISCATCHHPDLGFSDGLAQSVGRGGEGVGPDRTGGVTLTRNAPTLWNVGYNVNLFWDGRVDQLEQQAFTPLTHEDEMAADTDALVAELNDIPQYVAMFEDAFGGGEDAVSAQNISYALAAFERTLVSNDSPFDRYAAGELDALSPSQRRGLNLFRSAATRCFECHTTPMFATETFRVVGVPDFPGLETDLGRADVVDDGEPGAFKVPTLRNIALTAPYMHNGVFDTLEDVIDFYAEGGNHGFEDYNIDPFIQGFDFTDQEKNDLIDFLFALTDESNMPVIPSNVPSGLPVVDRLDNPARDLAEDINVDTSAAAVAAAEPRTLTVQPGQTIQSVADQARPGDTIMIPYGTYYERVAIDVNEITILGIPNADGEWPTLDGQNKLSEAVISSGNDFEVGFLRVINYTDNGILVEGVTGVYLHDIYAENTGTYGLYPVQSTNVLIENSEVIGADDAGIYAGQSENVIVRNNVVHGNVLGIELENTVTGEVYDNYAYNNTNAILIVVLPQITSKVSLDTVVYNNVIENNNHENFAKEGTAAALMPAGSGIALVGSDNVEVYGNTITGNKTAGIGVFSLTVAYDRNEIDVGPTPENIWIHDNTFDNNGYDADEFVTSMGISGGDLLWDVSGWNVRFDQPDATAFLPVMPTSDWSDFTYTLYWRMLNVLINLLG